MFGTRFIKFTFSLNMTLLNLSLTKHSDEVSKLHKYYILINMLIKTTNTIFAHPPTPNNSLRKNHLDLGIGLSKSYSILQKIRRRIVMFYLPT